MATTPSTGASNSSHHESRQTTIAATTAASAAKTTAKCPAYDHGRLRSSPSPRIWAVSWP